LYASFLEVDGEFRFATAKNSNDLDEIQKFLEDAIDHRSLS
jgi:DNA ligase-1